MPDTAAQLGIDLTDNAVADLGAATLMVAPERCLLRAPVTDAVRTAGGLLSVGVLAVLADVSACQPALAACTPDWTATADLSVHTDGRPLAGPVVLDCRLLRIGSKTAVVRVDLHDGDGVVELHALHAALGRGSLRRTGRAHVTFARLPRTAARSRDTEGYAPQDWVGEVREHPAGRRVSVPLAERTGVRRTDRAGVLELDLTPYVANSIGTVNGGVQGVLAQLAAEDLRPGSSCIDLALHFLRQSRSGPLRTRATLVRQGPGTAVVEVDLLDASDDERVLTTAVATLHD